MPPEHPPEIAALIKQFFRSRSGGRRVSVDQVLAEAEADLDAASRQTLISGIAQQVRWSTDSSNASSPAAFSGSESASLPSIPGYDLIELIGRGGMGAVYEAYQRSTGRRVAVKLMLDHVAANGAARRRFEREVELVARLQHPGIVPVLDSGVHAEHPFFIQEFVDGVTLDVFLASRVGPTDDVRSSRLSLVLGLVIELCDAVEYAHQRGVLHRDLKPSNILIDGRGHPRIVDFGLAKDIDPSSLAWREQTLALPGDFLGTLGYMAPEQAHGEQSAISVRSDVYSLGVLAYEALTGQLPCPAHGTLPEFLQRLEHEEACAPSMLTSGLSADVDAVLLKALDKNPARRFASAAHLHDDLNRIVRHEPVQARPIGSFGRTVRWARRHPTRAVLGGALLILLGSATGGGLWLRARNSVTALAVEGDLHDIAQFEQRSLWPDAAAALERAKGRLGSARWVNLRQRIDEAERNLKLVARLDEIRLGRVDFVQTDIPDTDVDSEYERAFADANLADLRAEPALMAERIRGSDVRDPIMAGLMDWGAGTSDRSRGDWIGEVASLVDPVAWREHVTDPDEWSDPTTLAEWARTVSLKDQPIHKLIAMSQRISDKGGDAIAFLRRIQREHPDDLWANLQLSISLRAKPSEAVGFARAAASLRPRSAVVRNNLGVFLAESGQLAEAVVYFEDAVRIGDHPGGHINLGYIALQRGDPATAVEHFDRALHKGVRNAFLHNGYGLALKAQGRLDDAIDQFEKALTLAPEVAVIRCNLAQALVGKGRLEEAIEHYREATRLVPQDGVIQGELWTLVARTGRLEDARAGWERTVEADPSEHAAWFGYAELCLFLGHKDEYLLARKGLLARFGTTSDPVIAERTGRSCLLLPASGDELGQAVALCERPIADTKFREAATYRPYFLFVQGLAAYRQGRLDETLQLMQSEAAGVLGPAPRLVLAMAQQHKGLHAQAAETLAAAISSFDWRLANAIDQEKWTFHVLRREAEDLILGDVGIGR